MDVRAVVSKLMFSHYFQAFVLNICGYVDRGYYCALTKSKYQLMKRTGTVFHYTVATFHCTIKKVAIERINRF